MDMQIVRLTNLSWLQFSDRQAFALRLVSPPAARPKGRLDSASTQALEHLPILDWPTDLFADEIRHQ